MVHKRKKDQYQTLIAKYWKDKNHKLNKIPKIVGLQSKKLLDKEHKILPDDFNLWNRTRGFLRPNILYGIVLVAADHKWKALGQSKFNTGKDFHSPLKTIIMKIKFYQNWNALEHSKI